MELNFDRLLVISFGFFFLFSAFFTASSLGAKVLADNQFGNLGFYSMGFLYLVFAFACFSATSIVNRLGSKYSLIFSSLCYTVYISTFILSSFRGKHLDLDLWYLNKTFIIVLVYFAAAVNGLGAATLWVAQGEYVALCANDSNKGFYNSVFYAIFMMSSIFGNLMSAFIIESVDEYVFYIIMTIISIFASLFFLLLKDPLPHQETKDEMN